MTHDTTYGTGPLARPRTSRPIAPRGDARTMIGRAPWRSKMVLNGQDAIAIMTSMTVGPAMTMGRAMASSPAMADPVTAGSQNVAPQPMSWVTDRARSEEHTSELQSLMRISYAVFCLK